jgi:hypothetical protein
MLILLEKLKYDDEKANADEREVEYKAVIARLDSSLISSIQELNTLNHVNQNTLSMLDSMKSESILQKTISTGMNVSLQRNNKVIAEQNRSLNPLLPMEIMLDYRVPFADPGVAELVKCLYTAKAEFEKVGYEKQGTLTKYRGILPTYVKKNEVSSLMMSAGDLNFCDTNDIGEWYDIGDWSTNVRGASFRISFFKSTTYSEREKPVIILFSGQLGKRSSHNYEKKIYIEADFDEKAFLCEVYFVNHEYYPILGFSDIEDCSILIEGFSSYYQLNKVSIKSLSGYPKHKLFYVQEKRAIIVNEEKAYYLLKTDEESFQKHGKRPYTAPPYILYERLDKTRNDSIPRNDTY